MPRVNTYRGRELSQQIAMETRLCAVSMLRIRWNIFAWPNGNVRAMPEAVTATLRYMPGMRSPEGRLWSRRLTLETPKKRNSTMATGKLKMWNADRGYGFVGDDSGGPDLFLHVSALESAGIDPLTIRKGDRLTYDVESTLEGKTPASNRRPPG